MRTDCATQRLDKSDCRNATDAELFERTFWRARESEQFALILSQLASNTCGCRLQRQFCGVVTNSAKCTWTNSENSIKFAGASELVVLRVCFHLKLR